MTSRPTRCPNHGDFNALLKHIAKILHSYIAAARGNCVTVRPGYFWCRTDQPAVLAAIRDIFEALGKAEKIDVFVSRSSDKYAYRICKNTKLWKIARQDGPDGVYQYLVEITS